MKTFSAKIIIFVIAVLIIVSGASVFYILRFQGMRGLDLALMAPTDVLSGAPFDLNVNFSNNSGVVLKDARLTLVLPEGAAFFGRDIQKNIDTKSLGNVGVGGLVQETYKVILFTDEGSKKEFKATLNYSTASLDARFDKSNGTEVTVSSSGIVVEMSVPEKLVSGEEFEIGIAYQNISDIDFSNLELKLEYPPTFSFLNASLKPDRDNNLWQLGDLRKNSEGKFTIKGSLIGLEGDSLEFKSDLTVQSAGQRYLINRNSVKTLISSSPLSLSIRVNNDSDYMARSGDMLNYTISYINNTDTALKEGIVRVQLVGEMFDINSLTSRGFFRSADNTLIWNSANTPDLALLPPGAAGVVNFSIKTKESYPIRRFSDKNFVLLVNAEIESPTIPQSINVSRTFSKNRLETKVFGNVMVDAQAYFRDAESGFLNRGLFPPRIGEATNFTIHWLLKNFANDISNIEVRGRLGNNVRMVGQTKSNVGSIPSYELNTNEVVWHIDKIQANQGVVSNPIEAIFQIEAIPTSESAGNYLPLLDQTIFKATDDFTGREIFSSDLPITTALPDDITVGQQGGVVQP